MHGSNDFHIIKADCRIYRNGGNFLDFLCGIARKTQDAVDIVFVADVCRFAKFVRFHQKFSEFLHKASVFCKIFFFDFFRYFCKFRRLFY